MNKKRVFILSLIVVVLAGVFLWLKFEKTDSPETQIAIPATTTTLANPASVNCTEKGGELRIQTKEDGSQYGLCYFDDARACEEWAMLRGDCPVGGVKTTGYDTLAQKYCAWLGGRTTTVADSVCTFKDGSTCLDADLYLGACESGEVIPDNVIYE